VGNDQLSIHFTRLHHYLKSSEFFARESCSRAVIPLPKNLFRKIARFFVSKIGPATGVTNYDETKSKEEKNKKNGSKKKAHRGHSVRYRSWWKQGNIKMAVSEDHASCWVHKDLTVTTKQIQALLTTVRASGGKDGCQVRLTGIE